MGLFARFSVYFGLWHLLLAGSGNVFGQAYGLAGRQSLGAYLNGRLPAMNPGGGGTWGTEVAFNLTFQSPVKMIPQPLSTRLWVIGREGHVHWFENTAGVSTKTLALDLSAVTQGWGDCGLLSIAFHPDFGKSGSPNRNYLYLYYNFSPTPVATGDISGVDSFNRLSRFTLADGATTIDRATEYVLINQFDEQSWHNGGDMYFGPDGFLYVTNGDEGGANDNRNNAQKVDSGLFSGVLRIDVNRDATRSHPIRRQPLAGGTPVAGWPGTYTQGYYIPNDNPWLDAGGSILEEFWAIGLRSPHRMSYDALSGQTFIGEVGQGTMEEVNVLAKGANYQWPYLEGTVTGPKARPNPLRGADTPPLYEYDRSVGDTCVIGGIVYRGAAHASAIGGRYIFGDHASGRIFSMLWDQGVPAVTQLTSVVSGNHTQGLSGFGCDQNNEIYLMTLGTAGRILKLTRTNTNPPAPATLSATGAFDNLATLTPASGIVPYDVNTPLWSDGAAKKRWIALPSNGAPHDASETITFASSGAWQFPAGTVLIKHFELPTDARNPALVKRLETRLLVRDSSGSTYGVTYKWRADNSDADLLPGSLSENVTVTDSAGIARSQAWFYPSRENCQACHTSNAGYVLGAKTAQLNGSFLYPSTGATDNQLRTWARIGMFSNTPAESAISALPKMVGVENTAATLETRVRSYLDANCAQCHRPGGVNGNWDGRFETPLAQQNIVNGLVNDSLGILGARVVVPGQISPSIAHVRLGALDATKMPPLAKNVVHTAAVNVLGQWINALASGALPAPWAGRDVGAPAFSGTDSYASGKFTITGGGADIWGTADQFHFVAQALTGDGEIIARVTSQTASDVWAKAGVMIRETLDASSRHAMIILTPSRGLSFQWRPATAGSSLATTVGSNAAPNNWVRLVRSGNLFTAYQSKNGTAWTKVGTATIPMAAAVQIGLAVTSHNPAAASTANLDNVQIRTPAPLPLPSVTLALPNGFYYTAPAAIAFTASVTANGNTISKVQFLNGSTVLGEDSTAPYAFTWSAVPAGTYALAARVITAAGTQATSAAANVEVITASGLPVGWATQDLGAPALAGRTSYSGGVYTVRGAGADIWNTRDEFRYVWQRFTGNGEIIARVTSQTATDPWAKAGVMLREALQANARHAMMALTPSNGTGFQYRALTGDISAHFGASANPAPNNWLRLIRNGSLFAGYRSADGVAWTQVGAASISMAAVINAGLAVTSHDTGEVGTALFDNVRVAPSTLPAPWAGVDIGAPILTDLERFAGGVYTIAGGGAAITLASDQFHYVWKTMSGDGEIIARITAHNSTASAAAAGVMFRENLNANSRHATMLLSPGSGFVFQRRLAEGSSTSEVFATANTAPNNWVRLARSGNTYTGYCSADGATWKRVSITTFTMPSTIHVGFAVCSGDDTKIGKATFDNARTLP